MDFSFLFLQQLSSVNGRYKYVNNGHSATQTVIAIFRTSSGPVSWIDCLPRVQAHLHTTGLNVLIQASNGALVSRGRSSGGSIGVSKTLSKAGQIDAC